MTDLFSDPEEPIKFDRWGRYILLDPFTSQSHSWTRASTFSGTIRDPYALNAWQQRMTAKGMALRPDLVAMASTLDVKRDRTLLDDLVSQAKDAAGHKVAANTGTAIHSFAEEVDLGRIQTEDIPHPIQGNVRAYKQAMDRLGLKVIPELIERVVCLPAYQVAGKFDRVLQESSGDYVIGDIKSGSSLEYGWLEICVQLAVYAHAINTAGVWEQTQRRWNKDVPRVRTDYGIVMHVPASKGTCTLYKIDLETGWDAVQLCASVREMRNAKDLSEEYTGPQASRTAAPEAPQDTPLLPSWEERFSAVRTRGEASALYQKALREFGARSEELERLVKLGLKALEDV